MQTTTGRVALWAEAAELLVLSLAATKHWEAHATTAASTTAGHVAAPMAYANPTQVAPPRVNQALAALAAEHAAVLAPAEAEARIEVAVTAAALAVAVATAAEAHAVAVAAEAMEAAAVEATVAAVAVEATAAADTVVADVDKNKTIAAIPNRLPLSSRTST